MNELFSLRSSALPELVAAADERAGMRFLEFFAANIRNLHTRRAYARAADEFLTWCAAAGVQSIAAVQPVHVATWIEAGTHELAAPSVKPTPTLTRRQTVVSNLRPTRAFAPGSTACPYAYLLNSSNRSASRSLSG